MNFDSVFEAHPEVDVIYVCDGMPFLSEAHADSHSMTTKQKVETIKRSTKATKEKDKPKEDKTGEKPKDGKAGEKAV